MFETGKTEKNLRTAYTPRLCHGERADDTLRRVDEEPVRDAITEIARTRLMKERNYCDRVVKEDPNVKMHGKTVLKNMST